MKVAIIGAGNMGGAIARGLCGPQSPFTADDIYVSNPSWPKLEALKKEFPEINVTTDNCVAAVDADIIILAVKPWLMEPVCHEIPWSEGRQIVISVAAGITLAQLDELTGLHQKALFRLVPNTAISLGESMTLMASQGADEEDEQQILRIFQTMGQAMLIPESKIAAATAMTSCGIAYALKYIQAAMQAGIELGIYPKDGMKMVAQSMKGAAELILQNDTHPSVEIDKVCTPGGITIKGINTLEHEGFSSALIKAIKASC